MSDQKAATQPQFYKSPEPLDPARHADLRFLPGTGYGFAREATAVMITAAEFVHVAKHYPIVFTETNPSVPVAVLGVRKGENLFVREDGTWEPGHYIPAYIRRYPFAFVSSADGERLILCIDQESGHLAKGKKGEALFEKGEPSQITKNALEFCTAFQRQHNVTQQLCDALGKHSLLTRRRADVSLGPDEKTAVTDFLAATEESLSGLSDKAFLELRKNGLLGFLYIHLMSLTNFNRLAELAAIHGMKAAPASKSKK